MSNVMGWFYYCVSQSHLPDPDVAVDDEERQLLTTLRTLVERHMVHTPCENNPDSYCRLELVYHYQN